MNVFLIPICFSTDNVVRTSTQSRRTSKEIRRGGTPTVAVQSQSTTIEGSSSGDRRDF